MNSDGSTPATPMSKLSVVITIGFFAVLVLLMFAPINLSLKDPLLLMLGALIANFNSVISFYFGTTRTSQTKDDTIQALTSTAASVAATAQVTQAGPIQTDSVAIETGTVNVNPVKGSS